MFSFFLHDLFLLIYHVNILFLLVLESRNVIALNPTLNPSFSNQTVANYDSYNISLNPLSKKMELFTPPPLITNPKEMESIKNSIKDLSKKILDSSDLLILKGFDVHVISPYKLSIRHSSSERLFQLVNEKKNNIQSDGSLWISGWDSINVANHEKIGIKSTFPPYEISFDFKNNKHQINQLSELYPVYLKWNPQIHWDENIGCNFVNITIGFGKLTAPPSFIPSFSKFNQKDSLDRSKVEKSDIYHYIGPIKLYLTTTLISHPDFMEIFCKIPIEKGKFHNHKQVVSFPSQMSFISNSNSDSTLLLRIEMAERAIATRNPQIFDHIWQDLTRKENDKEKVEITPVSISMTALSHQYFNEALKVDHDWISGRDKKGKSLRMNALINFTNEQLLENEKDLLVKSVIKKDFKEILNILNNPKYNLTPNVITKCIRISSLSNSHEILSFLIGKLKPYLMNNQKLVCPILGLLVHNSLDPSMIKDLLDIYQSNDAHELILVHILRNLNPMNIINYSQKLGINPQNLLIHMPSVDYRGDYDKISFAIYCYLAIKDLSIHVIDQEISARLKGENLENLDFILFITQKESRNPFMINFLKDKLSSININNFYKFPNIANLLDINDQSETMNANLNV